MKTPIWNINNDFKDDYLDIYEPSNEEIYEEEDSGEWLDCEMCNSTGEGHASGQRCSWCKGSGVIRRNI